jgi:hypothetical protein
MGKRERERERERKRERKRRRRLAGGRRHFWQLLPVCLEFALPQDVQQRHLPPFFAATLPGPPPSPLPCP